MRNFIDLKAIGYGLATFLVGFLIDTFLNQPLLNSKIYRFLMDLFGYVNLGLVELGLVLSVAGFISAYKARSHRILNGTIIGILVPVVGWIFFPFRGFAGWETIFLSVILSVVFASLGAILGSYWRGKRGA